MVTPGNETLLFADIDVNVLEQNETAYFSPRFGYSSEDLQKYQGQYTLQERWALAFHSQNRDPELKRAVDNISRENWVHREDDPAYQEQHRAFVARASAYLQQGELEKALRGERAGYEDLTKISMTQGALDTAYAYSHRVVDATGKSNEIYFHLTSNEGDTVARGVAVPRQDVSGGHCIPTNSPELTPGERIVGWSHSHGNLNVFHSGTDYNRLKTIPYLNGVRRSIAVQGMLVTPREVEVWVCPSVVVNTRNEYALAISSEYLDPLTDHLQIHIAEAPLQGREKSRYRTLDQNVKHIWSDNVTLEVLSDLSVVPSEEEVDRVIWERVHPVGGFTRAFEERMRAVPSTPSVLEEMLVEEFEEDNEEVHLLTKREYATILRKLETLQRNYNSLLTKYTKKPARRRFWEK